MEADPTIVHGTDWIAARESVAGRLECLISRETLDAELARSAAFADLDDEIAFLLRLFRAKVVFEIETGYQGPLLAVVAGGTNVGKSEVFNALARDTVAPALAKSGMMRSTGLTIR